MTENEKHYALIDIAITKAYTYAEQYNPYTGRAEDKEGYMYLKQGFTDGFLAGVAHRLTGGNDD